MNTRERFVRTLTGQDVDRVPFMKVFGGRNAIVPRWEDEFPGAGERIDEILGFEGEHRGWARTDVNIFLGQRGKPEILEETDEHFVQRFADGWTEIITKGRDYHHQTIGWPVQSRADWIRVKERHLQADDPERFPTDWEAKVESYRQRDYPLQLTHRGVFGFPRLVMGDARLFYAFYDEPDLVHDIMDTYTDTIIALWDKQIGQIEFDLIEVWEDMAWKSGALVSPQVFREFMTPNYRKIANYAKSHGIPIILVDSDGYIENLSELMWEAGVIAMYPYEAQSGNDVLRVRQRFPEMGIVGGLNKNVMAQDKEAIDAEMKRARRYIEAGRYIPGPDHFVLSDVSWENYRYFMEQLREVVLTTKPGCRAG